MTPQSFAFAGSIICFNSWACKSRTSLFYRDGSCHSFLNVTTFGPPESFFSGFPLPHLVGACRRRVFWSLPLVWTSFFGSGRMRTRRFLFRAPFSVCGVRARLRFGFLTAMASNFFFVTRNVLATKFGDVGDMGTAGGPKAPAASPLALLKRVRCFCDRSFVFCARAALVGWTDGWGDGGFRRRRSGRPISWPCSRPWLRPPGAQNPGVKRSA